LFSCFENAFSSTQASFFSFVFHLFNKMKCHVLNQIGVVEELLPSSKMGGMTLYIFSAQLTTVYANVWVTYLYRMSSVFSVCLSYVVRMSNVYAIRSHTLKNCKHVKKLIWRITTYTEVCQRFCNVHDECL